MRALDHFLLCWQESHVVTCIRTSDLSEVHQSSFDTTLDITWSCQYQGALHIELYGSHAATSAKDWHDQGLQWLSAFSTGPACCKADPSDVHQQVRGAFYKLDCSCLTC